MSVVGAPRPKKVCARISNTSLLVVAIDINFCHFCTIKLTSNGSLLVLVAFSFDRKDHPRQMVSEVKTEIATYLNNIKSCSKWGTPLQQLRCKCIG